MYVLGAHGEYYKMKKNTYTKGEKIDTDSRKKSLLETLIDIIIGFLLFLPVNFFVLPLFVDQIASQDILGVLSISVIYMSIALVRKYVLRRVFESFRG